MFIIKNYVIKRLRQFDVSVGPFVNIRPITHVLVENKNIALLETKSKMFYDMLVVKAKSRGNMETIYSREFNFDNKLSLWNNIYLQKLCYIYVPKLREFNFKLLNNILPCGLSLSKWKNMIASCTVCHKIETVKHMLFECSRIKCLWEKIALIVDIPISWKHIICGFPKYDVGTKLKRFNLFVTIVAYSIFKENSRCKFEMLDYSKVNIELRVMTNLLFYENVVKEDSLYIKRVFEALML